MRIVETERYRLLERLAESVLVAVMADERIATAHVTIAKPKLLDGATPVVSLSKMRPSLLARGWSKPKKNKKNKRAKA